MNTKVFCVLILIALTFISCSTVKPPITKEVVQDSVYISNTLVNKQERSLKRKVAIARFSNETKYGQGFFYDENNDRLGKQAMDILSTKLAATNKFIMLERADLKQIMQEKNIARLDTMNIPADYLLLGSITEFGRKTTSDVGVFSRSKKQTAYAKVSIRLVDTRTSQIIYTEEGEGEAETETETVLGMGNTASYDATLNDKVISAAISKLVNNIVEKLLDNPWRSFILSYENSSFIIAGGEQQGIKKGDVFTVYKRGKSILNPQSNTMVELPGKPVGKLEVVSLIPGSVTTELSICNKTEGELPADNFNEYYLQEK